MKALNTMNYFMMGIPLGLILTGLVCEETLLYYGLWFTLLTGAFQVVVGIGMFIDSFCKHRFILIYLVAVAIFFLLLFNTYWKWLAIIPPILAIYMTIILFIETKKEKNEH